MKTPSARIGEDGAANGRLIALPPKYRRPTSSKDTETSKPSWISIVAYNPARSEIWICWLVARSAPFPSRRSFPGIGLSYRRGSPRFRGAGRGQCRAGFERDHDHPRYAVHVQSSRTRPDHHEWPLSDKQPSEGLGPGSNTGTQDRAKFLSRHRAPTSPYRRGGGRVSPTPPQSSSLVLHDLRSRSSCSRQRLMRRSLSLHLSTPVEQLPPLSP